MINVALGVLAALFGQALMRERPDSAAVLMATALVLLYARRQARSGRHASATQTLLWTLALGSTWFVWTESGVRDTSIMTYPGILVFASLFGSRRQFLGLLAFELGVIGLVVLGDLQGWHVSRPFRLDFGTAFALWTILTGTAVVVRIAANDLHRARSLLEAENERVRRSQAEVEFQARHDALTGLPNRLQARERFELMAAHAQRTRSRVALMYLDLDHFKTINDAMGHPAGDRLLCEFAQRLSGPLRHADTVCRLGGDEFLLLLGDLRAADDMAALAEKLLQHAATPFDVLGNEVLSSASVGVAIFPDDGTSFDELLKCADTAMYCAKDVGRNAFRFYEARMNAGADDYLRLLSAIRASLDNDRFEVHYQPLLELGSGRLIGAEALLRCRHPELDGVSPARFIPVAEKSGLIHPLGRWVLQTACRQAAQWRADGLSDFSIAVNVSPLQFHRGEVEDAVTEALRDSGLPASALKLELTESLLVAESAPLHAVLQRLRLRGVGLAIDDFGTGYSNLAYLKRFDIETLKIDRSFVRGLCSNAQDEAIVTGIVQMAHGLGLRVVAEGVEDDATLQRLQTLRCDQGQGYLWAAALPAAEFRSRAFPVQPWVPAASAARASATAAGSA